MMQHLVCDMLQVSDQPLYNWAKAWRTRGLGGLLGGHQGGAPRKLTDPLLDEAAQKGGRKSLEKNATPANLNA